ncbi:MAG: hypothetical protein QOJ59_5561 [Thermomicrobiales bacterium]|nr:hypothetical protein [Thermomicrobiales bacterium]
MSAFLAVIGKRGPVSPEQLRRIPELAAIALPFRHMAYRGQQWQSVSGQAVLFVWDNDLSGEPERSLIYERGHTAIAIAGYVAHPAIANGFDLATIASSVTIDAKTAPQLGGAFAVLQADGQANTVIVWNTATRLVGVFFAENDDLIVIGTRALLVSLVLTGRSQPEYAPEHLAPFLSCGYLASEQTPYRGVNVVPANARLTASPSCIISESIDDFDKECGTILPTEVDYDEIADRLVNAVGHFGDTPILCGLTGGKDSRLVAAALHAAGSNFRTRTNGFPDHPDVIIAGRVAQALGIDHGVSEPQTTEHEGVRTMSIDLAARARNTLFVSDGMLSAYENIQLAKSLVTTRIQMGGAGGESLRGGFAKSIPDTDDISWERARRWMRGRFLGQSDVLDPAAVIAYEAFLNNWVEQQQEMAMRPAVALDKLYVYYRTGRWKAAARAGRHGARDVEPLTDNLITKAGLRIHESVKLNDVLIHELLKRLAPSLIDIPFANKRWLFEKNGPRPGHEEEWNRRAPLSSPPGSPSAFNWRTTVATDLFEAFYDQIFNDRRASGLFDVVDREKLHKLVTKQRGTRVAGGRVGLYWAAYTASVLLSNAWLDPAGESRPVSINVPAEPAS